MTTMIDKVAWIHIVDRSVLGARSHGKDTFYLPGGKREPGESDELCLIREVSEELGVDVLPETIAFVGLFEAQAHGKQTGTTVQMACYAADYTGDIVASAEIAEVAWLTYADRERTSAVTQLIFEELRRRDLID